VLYLATLGALAAVLAVGHAHFGARRWVEIAGMPIQVSELAKLVIIIALARFLCGVRSDRLTFADLVKIGAVIGLPLGLVLLQPDLGTALTLVPVAIVGAFLAGIRWKHALVLVVLAVLSVPVAWHFVLKPYQKARITSFLKPEEDPRGSGYQILQSEIAVGAGGLWGKGLGRGSQNQLGFVPVRYSDFILAAVGEEMGFAGVFLTLLLYAGLLLRLILNAQQAKDRAGMYLIGGVAAILGFHVFVNAAMVIGWMPVTGIPLPLVSYGGSATLFVFMALGLVMSVRLRRFVN
jgi:rod shape determining protein RodA